MKKSLILMVLSVLILSATAFGQDNYVKYCKAEIFLTEQISAEDIASLNIAPNSQVESLDNPARVIAEIPQADLQVLIDVGVEAHILGRYVLYSAQTDISQQMAEDIGVDPVASTTTPFFRNGNDYTIPEYPNGKAISSIDMRSFGDGLVYKIDLIVGVFHPNPYTLVGKIKNQSNVEYTVFEGDWFATSFQRDGIEDFKRQPIAQIWYFTVEEVCYEGWECGYGDDGFIMEWSIRFNYGPPENDECSGAKVISNGVEYEGLTDFATGSGASDCSYGNYNDVWFKYTAAESGNATISTQGSSYDTTLTVYDGCGGNELTCNDQAGGTNQSEITMYLSAGNTYYVRLASFYDEFGDYTIKLDQVLCDLPSPATNPAPANGRGQVLIDGLMLEWDVAPVPGSPEVYDIYFDTVNPPVDLIAANVSTNTFKVALAARLDPYVKYYWKIVTKNDCDDVSSPVWSFTTTAFASDYNNDGVVDNEDLCSLVFKWLESDGSLNLAGGEDNMINFEDFAMLVQDWLKTSP